MLMLLCRKNSAQKTIHRMLDNDPRYLRPDTRDDMNQRVAGLFQSSLRLRRRASLGTLADASETGSVQEDHDETMTLESGLSVSGSDVQGVEDSDLQQGTIQRRTRSSSPTPSSSTSRSVQDIQRRISNCSVRYARQISSLLRRFTISGVPDSPRNTQGYQPRVMGEGPSSDPRFALPGDLLGDSSRACHHADERVDDLGICWCSIRKTAGVDENSWFLPDGAPSEQAQLVLSDPSGENLSLCDSYGNSALHMLAAREGCRDVVLGIVLDHPDSVRFQVNTGRQSFLHLLHVEWFSDPMQASSPLRKLLSHVHNSHPQLPYAQDAYGRTFFHLASSIVNDDTVLAHLMAPLDASRLSRRDAFGKNLDPVGVHHASGPTTPSPTRKSPSAQAGKNAETPTLRDDSGDGGSAFIAFHAQLVGTIQSAYSTPEIEDADGRCALHSLAEAILDRQTLDQQRLAHDPAGPDAKATKTKPASSRPQAHVSPMTSAPAYAQDGGESALVLRLRHLQGLLAAHPADKLDANHYSRAGTTPLMAFIVHIPDAHEDRARSLRTLLDTLITAGGADLERRNRHGETALLVAARLGRKIALSTLLDRGANVHARDASGRGVMEVLDVACRACWSGSRDKSGDDGEAARVAMYARLEACRALLTGRRGAEQGVMQQPAWMEEWSRTVEE
jgi:ankyrin repeat protein